MKNIKDVCVIIQARLSSQRIPKKMIKPFSGQDSLIDIALDKILQCESFDRNRFYLSAHEEELRGRAAIKDLQCFDRSEASANTDNDLKLMYEWWDKLPYKYVVLINPCLPFLKPDTIDHFVASYTESNFRGMFGVIETKDYYWNNYKELALGKLDSNGAGWLMNTKTAGNTYKAAHALYAGQMSEIGRGLWMGNFQYNDPVLFPMKEEECFDIDYPWQFDVYSQLYNSGWRP